jgi:hypothetical protein
MGKTQISLSAFVHELIWPSEARIQITRPRRSNVDTDYHGKPRQKTDSSVLKEVLGSACDLASTREVQPAGNYTE